jgi:ubiquinone/menaquinone biosynthesis C-methylase UbiE
LGGPLRVVLEGFLKRVAEKMEFKVKYKFDGKYTSGDFSVRAGIQNEIRKSLIAKSPAEEADITQDVGRVFGTGDLINFLSHDNPRRLEVTLPDAKDFVAGIKALTKRCQDNHLIKRIGG